MQSIDINEQRNLVDNEYSYTRDQSDKQLLKQLGQRDKVFDIEMAKASDNVTILTNEANIQSTEAKRQVKMAEKINQRVE